MVNRQRVFITGGSGFIGSHLINRLLEKDYDIVCLTRSKIKINSKTDDRLQFVHGDLSDYNSLAQGMRNCEGIFHLASRYSLLNRERRNLYKTNVVGTLNLFKAAKLTGIKKIVLCSTVATYGDTGGQTVNEKFSRSSPFLSQYEKTKSIIEKEALNLTQDGLSIMIVQPGTVLGVGGRGPLFMFMSDFLKRRIPFLVSGNPTFSFVGVNDVALGLIQIYERGKSGEKYILSECLLTTDDLIKKIEEIGNVKRPRLVVPIQLIKPLIWAGEWFSYIFKVKPIKNLEILKILSIKSWAFSSEKARVEIDWNPMSFETSLNETIMSLNIQS